ncbi:MAG: TPM domain-containing protein [Gemmatimonadota bacterium]
MRLFPRNPKRLFLILALGALVIGGRYSTVHYGLRLRPRLRDEAKILTGEERGRTEQFLDRINDESNVDIRILLVPSVPGGDLEGFALRRARDLGVGKESGRRGLLIVYDLADRRMRLEVGAKLEGFFTDAFAGYLVRQNATAFFAAGKPEYGLRTTLILVLYRLRQAVLGDEFDPRIEDFVTDTRRLAVGGGATAEVFLGKDSSGFRNRSADSLAKEYFSPQPTPEETYQRYLQWLALDALEIDVPMLTVTSREWMADLPVSNAYGDYMLSAEQGRRYRIVTRGALAMLYYTNDPFAGPHYFRRGRHGWEMDLFAEVLATQNLVGYPYTWTIWNGGGDFQQTFGDLYIDEGRIWRIAGGDNRQLPVKPSFWSRLWRDKPDSMPPVRSAPPLEEITVDDAASRLAAARTRPSLVILFDPGYDAQRDLFRGLARAAVRDSAGDVFAFTTDGEDGSGRLAWLLERYPMRTTPMRMLPWEPGSLNRAMATVGIKVGQSWSSPLVAVRDRYGEVVMQGQDVHDLTPYITAFEAELESEQH